MLFANCQQGLIQWRFLMIQFTTIWKWISLKFDCAIWNWFTSANMINNFIGQLRNECIWHFLDMASFCYWCSTAAYCELSKQYGMLIRQKVKFHFVCGWERQQQLRWWPQLRKHWKCLVVVFWMGWIDWLVSGILDEIGNPQQYVVKHSSWTFILCNAIILMLFNSF